MAGSGAEWPVPATGSASIRATLSQCARPAATASAIAVVRPLAHHCACAAPRRGNSSRRIPENVANQILEGNRSIVGLMLESNLHWGNQPIPADRASLQYGVSVTDPCIDWETTEGLLQSLDGRLRTAPRFARDPAAA